MNEFTKEELQELELVHKLENLSQFLRGSHFVCDHDNARLSFLRAGHIVQDIITWVKWGRIPKPSQLLIEKLTKGRLKADWE